MDREYSDVELRLRLPFGMMVGGPSSSGKTEWVLRFLRNAAAMITPQPAAILYCYGEYSAQVPTIERMGIHTIAGLPSDEQLDAAGRPLLLVLDDLMLTATESWVSELFTKKLHHRCYGVAFVTQNMFEKSLKVARQNCQYFVLMRAPNAALGIRNLGTQIFPKQLQFFLAAYADATREPYGYLFVDLHPASDATLRLRTHVFPDEITAVYTT